MESDREIQYLTRCTYMYTLHMPYMLCIYDDIYILIDTNRIEKQLTCVIFGPWTPRSAGFFADRQIWEIRFDSQYSKFYIQITNYIIIFVCIQLCAYIKDRDGKLYIYMIIRLYRNEWGAIERSNILHVVQYVHTVHTIRIVHTPVHAGMHACAEMLAGIVWLARTISTCWTGMLTSAPCAF